MFDITHYIKLDTKKQRIYVTLRVFLIGVFIVIVALFIRELIFPSQTFYFKSAIDSLANTITRPYLTEHGTGFDISTYGEFDTIHISITLDKTDSKLPKNTEVIARKSYRAFFSPMSKEKYIDHITQTYEIDDTQYTNRNDALYRFVSKNAFDSYIFKENVILTNANIPLIKKTSTNVAGFASGSLISSKDGIFVTNNNTKHAIQDEFVFKSLGYNFDNVIKANSEELGVHKKARMFDMTSTHPFGTIFFARDAERMYVYDNDQLHKVTNTALAQQNAIIVDERSRTTFDHCVLKDFSLFARTYTCTIHLDTINDFAGNTYQFVIEDMPNVNIEKSKITFSTISTDHSFSQRVEMIKKELNKYYRE